MNMNKAFWVATTIAAVVTLLASAQSEIPIVSPLSGDSVSACPTFSWFACRYCSEAGYDVIITNKTSGAVVQTLKSIYTSVSIVTHDLSSLLSPGDYTYVVQQGVHKSLTVDFIVCPTHSCQPEKTSNKINEEFRGFTIAPAGNFSVQTVTSRYQLKVDSNDITVALVPDGSNLLIVADSEKEHMMFSAISPPFKKTKYDNVFAFHYAYIFMGLSEQMDITLEYGSTKKQIACINRQDVSCLSGGRQHSESFLESNWDYSEVDISDIPDDTDLKLAVRYNYKGGVAIAHFRRFVFGECSSFNEKSFNFTSGLCSNCPGTGTYIPQNMVSSSCPECVVVSGNSACCATMSYCTACKSNNMCEMKSTSTCEKDANCVDQTNEQDCTDVKISPHRVNCLWCNTTDKCYFHANAGSCPSCSSFSTMGTCPVNVCKWCGVSRKCVIVNATCPSCDALGKDYCQLALTDNTCQYCNDLTQCLSVSLPCFDCPSLVQGDCNANEDCAWCDTSRECTEKRTPCMTCQQAQAQSLCRQRPGCKECETGFCSPFNEQCVACSEQGEKGCSVYINQTVRCTYCDSDQTCLAKGTDCKDCKVFSAADCLLHKGCTYCQSLASCVPTASLCDKCPGLTSAACAKNSKGCCWSEKARACYDLGDSQCSGSISVGAIAGIAIGAAVVVALAIALPIIFCKRIGKANQPIEMPSQGTIVVLPEGQPSMVVGQDSLQSLDGSTAVSLDTGMATVTSPQGGQMSVADMQNMVAQQQMMNSMLAQQQMSAMMGMNPMMMNSMMGGMGGMGMNSMDMGSMGMSSMAMSGMGMGMGMNMMGTDVAAPPDQPTPNTPKV